jgi:excisionase family DNA binding protein
MTRIIQPRTAMTGTVGEHQLPPPPLSVDRVAEYLGCEAQAVRRLIRCRKLGAVKIGGRWRIPQAALSKLLEAGIRI